MYILLTQVKSTLLELFKEELLSQGVQENAIQFLNFEDLAYEVLANGADVATLDIAFAPNVTKEYNAELCELLGVTVPGDYVAIEG